MNLQQRIEAARIEALARSVGRSNGSKGGFLSRLLGVRPRRRGDLPSDFRPRGEDVWRALRF